MILLNLLLGSPSKVKSQEYLPGPVFSPIPCLQCPSPMGPKRQERSGLVIMRCPSDIQEGQRVPTFFPSLSYSHPPPKKAFAIYPSLYPILRFPLLLKYKNWCMSGINVIMWSGDLILSWKAHTDHSDLLGEMHYSFLQIPFFGPMKIQCRFIISTFEASLWERGS